MIKIYRCPISNTFFSVTLFQFVSSSCKDVFVTWFWWQYFLLVNNVWSCPLPKKKPIYITNAYKDFLSISLTYSYTSYFFSFFPYSSGNINIFHFALNLFNSLIISRSGFLLLLIHSIFYTSRISFSIPFSFYSLDLWITVLSWS